MLLAVAGDDRDSASADLIDLPDRLADHDYVARFDRAVHQQDDPRSKVAEDLLKPEA